MEVLELTLHRLLYLTDTCTVHTCYGVVSQHIRTLSVMRRRWRQSIVVPRLHMRRLGFGVAQGLA